MTTQTAYNEPAIPYARSGGPGALISRVLLAALFLIAGIGKLAAPAGTIAYITAAGLPLPTIAYAVALLVELGGGVLLIVGYRTRLVAAVMAVFTVVTALAFHSAWGDANQQVNFLKNLAIAGGLLQLVLNGAGAYSLDRRAR
ncbi:DoxX family protein [Bordetella genomosp. 9]|uniref:DoxX family protein n=1 Tax=Bordetella genomosp. 9 TaxID=1416803 RepID=UPI0026820A6A